MEAIQGLVLQLGELHKSEKAHRNLEAFPKMPNLKLLIIHDVQTIMEKSVLLKFNAKKKPKSCELVIVFPFKYAFFKEIGPK